MEEKKKDHANCGCGTMTDDVIRLREEISDQYKALAGMKKMAESYGYDIQQLRKLFSGYTLVTLLLSRLRTVLLCQ